ncbi:DUF945 family protein [Vibrio nigripulchritudo]|uniref:DUF945 family protein n=1 Tax=Vibrio nigripulchritudo TaxID=28173 RepID=UPI001ED9975C|nr:DUF945 family protein [Vibrio nigripulchritudo]
MLISYRMHSLKKLGAIGGAIALTACWPLAVGQIAQTIVENGIQQLNSEGVKAEVVEYDRSYFYAQAITRYTITDPLLAENLEKDGLPTSIDVVHDISHGLLSIDAHSYVKDSKLVQFELATQSKLNGDTDFELVGRKFNFTDSSGSELIVGEYSATGSASISGALDYQASIPFSSVNFANGDELVVSGFTAKGNGQKEQGIWIGEQKMDLAGISLKTAGGQNDFQLSELDYIITSVKAETGETFDNQQVLTIEEATSGENVAKKVKLDFAFNGIRSDALEQLLSIYQSGAELTPEKVEQSMPLLDQLVEAGLEVELNKFAVNLNGGDFQSAWKLVVPAGQKNVSQNASILLNVVEGKLDAHISNELLQAYPYVRENIDELLIMEFATEGDKGVDLNANLNGGQVTFESGKQVPLLALFMPLMAGQR